MRRVGRPDTGPNGPGLRHRSAASLGPFVPGPGEDHLLLRMPALLRRTTSREEARRLVAARLTAADLAAAEAPRAPPTRSPGAPRFSVSVSRTANPPLFHHPRWLCQPQPREALAVTPTPLVPDLVPARPDPCAPLLPLHWPGTPRTAAPYTFVEVAPHEGEPPLGAGEGCWAVLLRAPGEAPVLKCVLPDRPAALTAAAQLSSRQGWPIHVVATAPAIPDQCRDVRGLLSCSFKHLTRETLDTLWSDRNVATTSEHGILVVPHHWWDCSYMRKDLRRLFEFVRGAASYVVLEKDGSVHPGLPTYEHDQDYDLD